MIFITLVVLSATPVLNISTQFYLIYTLIILDILLCYGDSLVSIIQEV